VTRPSDVNVDAGTSAHTSERLEHNLSKIASLKSRTETRFGWCAQGRRIVVRRMVFEVLL
jgi:hypothetical protein